ncbi:hypothetical protein B0H11DRAFT_2274387 [Mycena galericulata]|nr:hypothetical protein B0H11DRAFT_2274387 [Mycena galericulata]
MSSPREKSQRTEGVPTARSDIWHSDGSVVLQAGDTQFRVHWSILALNSSFFRSLQGLPQPPGQASIDGCPLILLSDSFSDVEHLLRALYTPALFSQKALPFPYIASFVRLGRKYDFKELLDIAVERLVFENPTDVDEYEALLKPFKASPADDWKFQTTRIVHYPGIHHDILTLARENDLLTVLPCAYFRVSTFSLVEIFDGVPRPDGTIATLTSMDQRLCALGRERLMKTQWEIDNTFGWMVSWNPSEQDGCLDSPRCRERKDRVVANFLRTPKVGAVGSPSAPALQTWFCSACVQRAQILMTAGRARMWESLPAVYNLPPWNELKNEL